MNPFSIFLSRDGRLPRIVYALASLAAWFAAMIAVVMLAMMTGLGLALTVITLGLAAPGFIAVAIAWMATVVIYGWVQVVLTAKRLHDMGMPGWHVVWATPLMMLGFLHVGPLTLVALLVAGWLTLTPGQTGPNRYGLSPA